MRLLGYKTLPALIAALALLSASPALAQDETDTDVTLEGRAILPSDTLSEGPSSGADAAEEGDDEVNGVSLPLGGQPIQGFSAVIDSGYGDGSYLALSDNGFGAKDNSADFLLRAHLIEPDFASGEIEALDYIQLSDPDGYIPFDIQNADTPERLLTGADFDPESIRRDASGDLWFGDEFGPFLLHTDETGRLLEAPIPLDGVQSPDNPDVTSEDDATLPSSKGFEGMAISDDLTTLYPMLEGALVADEDQRRLLINEYDIASGGYTGETWQYRLEDEEYAIGDFTPLGGGRFLVIERDNGEGEAAEFKKIYAVDMDDVDDEGYLVKREVANLLDISDPDGISTPVRDGDIGIGEQFAFPFQTIESVLPLGGGQMLVLNDNNYPFSLGRNPDVPDDNEAIILDSPALADELGEDMPDTGGEDITDLTTVIAGITLAALGLFVFVYRRRRSGA